MPSRQSSSVISRPSGLNPRQILRAALDRGFAAKEMPPPQHGVRVTKIQAFPREREELFAPVVEVPMHPGDLVVLRVRVVVAHLRAPDLVAVRQHRHALRERERRDEVAHDAEAHVEDACRIVRLALDAPVAADVVVVAVAIALRRWPRCAFCS